MKKKWLVLTGMALLAAGLCLPSLAGENLKDSLDSLPAAVQATIREHTAGAEIEEIELEKEDGKEIYSVEFKKDGKEIEIEVAVTGEFLGMEVDDEDEVEEKIELSAAPAAVQTAIAALTQGGAITAITRETEKGVTTYEAEFLSGGRETTVELAENGELLEKEWVVPAAELPSAIIEALNAKYPGAQIKTAEAVQVFSYEIELTVNGKTREVEILGSGKIKDDDDDDDD